MSKRRVAITGLGCICPLGNNVNDTWENALKGVSGVDCITQFDTQDFSVKIAGVVKDFVPQD